MRLATWNVNSIRSRIDRVAAFLDRQDIDVLAIQETKCRDDQFPYDRFDELGYEVAHLGINQWNGVAVASRVGLSDVELAFPDQPGFDKNAGESLIATPVVESRAIGATCGGVRVWSLYVPNGRALDDPHYAYKLEWLATLRDNAARWLAEDPQAKIALVGDWNIAPTDDDVWSPEFFAGKTHTSQPERDAFAAVLDTGFADVMRPFAPGPGVYTYWDYTQLRFPRKEGMRIDFVLASPALAAVATDAVVDREERKGKGASDHAPVIAEFTD
ncbi:exodeoxyribonuclease III [Nocardia cyriacigeorgica]|uniref:exodeoxyribonuclease III n=1 Tax=Nocardia cyriacigeorgica TaxID=135487 RepID=UPI001893D114|nr:exodeoxyribonuclease III [Nocardia cyriacigeorgica]MBF6315961.1 exodeoxyribonuclease III [Nocardia cyriacigeorgica]MBF6342494.1 exodeoxyribonuclease III [Nocardia cyriacigeorgica]MBF6530746.1 exodeoxyribonuclease III [Nocardia cyriacigeorgica]